MGRMITEQVKFRLILTPCCGQALCWINPRIPNYCPECGKNIFRELKFGGQLPEATDAILKMKPPSAKESL